MTSIDTLKKFVEVLKIHPSFTITQTEQAAKDIQALLDRVEELEHDIDHLKKCKEFESDLQMQIINFGAKYVKPQRKGSTYSVLDAWEAIKQALKED